jgi:hypothetical protein
METNFLACHLRPGQMLSYIPGKYNPTRGRSAKWPRVGSVKREGGQIVVRVQDDQGERVLKFGPDDLVPVIPEDADWNGQR